MIVQNDLNRSLSRVFTNPVFKEITQSGKSDYLISKFKKYSLELSIEKGTAIKHAIHIAYNYLSKNYRNEYVYKNTLINKILLGRHNLNTATLLNEFKVGNSIADVIILNGTSSVYEIKTELDSPEKLIKQISDYKKAFAKIYLVTHHSLVNKYSSLLENSTVGLLSLSDRFNLSDIKEAEEDLTHLDSDIIIQSLRKGEYSSILQQFYGYIPQVSNINYFKSCLALVKKIDLALLHDLMIKQLRKRIPQEPNSLQSEVIPKELKHICFCINPNQQEYTNLLNFLTLNL